MITRSRIAVESKEGKRFLKRVVSDATRLDSDQRWQARASTETEWKVEFSRTVKPKQIGDPEDLIVVETDQKLSLPAENRIGLVKSFSDSKPVDVRRPVRVWMNGETPLLARLMAEGWNLEVMAHGGSTSSSEYGLSFYSVYATNYGKFGYYGIQVGGETVAVNGKPIIRCAVDID
jgi:hypothetical protein